MLSNARTPWLAMIVTAASVVRGCSLLLAEVDMCGCGPPGHVAKADVAERQIARMLDVAADMRRAPGACPDLAGMLAGGDATDPWDQTWDFACDAGHVVIRSRGEDGVTHTLDDVVGREGDRRDY